MKRERSALLLEVITRVEEKDTVVTEVMEMVGEEVVGGEEMRVVGVVIATKVHAFWGAYNGAALHQTPMGMVLYAFEGWVRN